MVSETDTTGNDDELRLGSDQSFSPDPPPRLPEDALIRDYLNRKLDPTDEAEVQILVSTYREWAEAVARIARERS